MSFVTAVLMAVALCFHSVLEVCSADVLPAGRAVSRH